MAAIEAGGAVERRSGLEERRDERSPSLKEPLCSRENVVMVAAVHVIVAVFGNRRLGLAAFLLTM